mmetsp:Transcript_23221/g.53441  ORF Transcript_23221/g.53441 Transcript_23221/m.53441 type:complete len:604 (-) Transcript_23221:90-1901(-)
MMGAGTRWLIRLLLAQLALIGPNFLYPSGCGVAAAESAIQSPRWLGGTAGDDHHSEVTTTHASHDTTSHGDSHGDSSHDSGHATGQDSHSTEHSTDSHGDSHSASHSDGHSAAGGHSEDSSHAHGDDGHGSDHAYDASFAMILYGGLAFTLLLFYFVHASKHIASFTWSFIANIMSIFIAVSFWSAIARLIFDFCDSVGFSDDEFGPTLLFFLGFLAMLAFVSAMVCCLQWSYWAVITTLSIGSHFTGFGIYYFIAVFQLWLAHDLKAAGNHWALFGSAFLAYLVGSVVSLGILIVWTRVLGWLVTPHTRSLQTLISGERDVMMDEEEREANEHLDEQLEDFSIEAFALGSTNGLVRCFTVLFTSTLPDVHHRPDTTQVERSWMFMFASLSLGVALIVAFLHWLVERFNKKDEGGHHSHGLHLAFELLQVYTAFTAAWAFLEWVLWWLYTETSAHEVEGHVTLALVASAAALIIALFCGLILEFCKCVTGEEAFLRSCAKLAGLFAGLTWELVFDVALLNVEHDAGLGDWFSTLISFSMIIFMLPAYIWLVYPRSVIDSFDRTQGEKAKKHVQAEATTLERILGILSDSEDETAQGTELDESS